MLAKPSCSSPWGAVQHSREVIDGCWWLTTAGHGGYWVREDRATSVWAMFPEFKRSCFFEEDCDWCVVDLCFQAEITSDQTISHAVETALMCAGWESESHKNSVAGRWHNVKAWLESTEQGRICRQRYDSWKGENAGKWRHGGLSTILRRDFTDKGFTAPPQAYWNVNISRDGEFRTVIMPYPMQEYFTDAEISALEWKPERLPVPSHPVDGWRAEPSDLPGSGEDTDDHDVLDYSASCAAGYGEDYGGAFDGFTVTSDADPGL